MRGTPCCAFPPSPRVRFIPACAGNTKHADRRRNRDSVHPRLCGEHAHHPLRSIHQTGSSPPVRGTLAFEALVTHVHRFIPACAGNTRVSGSRCRCSTVHPRLCGEHQIGNVVVVGDYGSSPPVRGTPWLPEHRTTHHRFIPACAGNTAMMPSEKGITAVHPRLCGEHLSKHPKPHGKAGSSPPVRGTLGRWGKVIDYCRFIPPVRGTHIFIRVGRHL